MKRLVVLGPAGSGKSTLARRLGERLGIPVFHLDAINWEPGWKALPMDTFRSRLREAISRNSWITDGNYAILSFDLRMPRADLVIWVERPALHCAWRVIRRAIGAISGETRIWPPAVRNGLTEDSLTGCDSSRISTGSTGHGLKRSGWLTDRMYR